MGKKCTQTIIGIYGANEGATKMIKDKFWEGLTIVTKIY